jgi:hypothetical protein
MRIWHKFAVLAFASSLAFLLSTTALAQMNGFSNRNFGGATIHGVPPSVTSFGFGGTPGFHGVPPSVTSLNFGNVPFHASRSGFGFRPGPVRFRHHHHRGEFSPFFGGGYYIPYASDYDYGDPGYYVLDPGVDDSMEQEYRGGPTIFDRRGPGSPRHSRAEIDDFRSELNSEPQKSPEPAVLQPVADQPTTVLIFKDGRELEVHNYAIVGTTLYDLSDGRTHKVELAELDLPATVKHNDDRGVSFQLPVGAKLN